MNFRWLFPDCPAEKLLEENAKLSKQLTEKLDTLVEDATTVFHRPVAAPKEAERPARRVASG